MTSRKRKIRVCLLFGGKSAEHEISLRSTKNIAAALDKQKYDVILVGIDKHGRWLTPHKSNLLLQAQNPQLVKLNSPQGRAIVGEKGKKATLLSFPEFREVGPIDVVFPVLHGPFGEDGTIQGLLKLANIPYVGSGVLGSAVGMDKDVQKRLLREAGIRVAKCIVMTNFSKDDLLQAARVLSFPLFVKPANLGSSVGVTKVKTLEELLPAVKLSRQFDRKVLLEEYIRGREIECSVLGNENPICSLPGEVIPRHEFYSYEAKYIDENGAILEIPAKLTKKVTRTSSITSSIG